MKNAIVTKNNYSIICFITISNRAELLLAVRLVIHYASIYICQSHCHKYL